MNNLNFNQLCNLMRKPDSEIIASAKADMLRLKKERLAKIQKNNLRLTINNTANWSIA